MPPIGASITRWPVVFSIDVRMCSDCPLHAVDDQGDDCCDHPACLGKRKITTPIASSIGCDECPLEKQPVLLHRAPDWLHEAQREAIEKHDKER